MRSLLRLSILWLALLLAFVSCQQKWWETTVVYQIYPRSFKDSNGDGVGDLNGITQGLAHIKDAGVRAIWLSPIYKSPMYDFGYDIADFKQIQPEYGTMEDFENLLLQAKKLDIKVILDFVPNHSSNESEWFRLSANRTKGYENYFVWADGKADPNNPGKHLPPNNWVSVFRKSAWEFNAMRGQYYLHEFVIGQPDLNYREPLLVEEMKSVLRFWLEKGVAGFRVDAVPFLFEVDPKDFGGKFPDEPLSSVMGLSPDDYNYLDHIYTQNQEPTYDMIYQWRAVLDEFEKKDGLPRVMLVEAYADIKLVMRYYGNGTVLGAHLPFNFEFLNGINNNSDARDIKFVIDKWETYMPVGKVANWVNGNHDNSRMATRQGIDRADIMNMIALVLPGVALTYQGEELAMTDGEVSWEETKDPQACNTDDPINYYKSSRDPARTPFQWDDTKNAGFSTGNKTWLPVASNFKTINLKAQQTASRSHYKFYQDLVALRNTKVQMEGDLTVKALSENVLAVMRSLPNKATVVAIANLSPVEETVDLAPFRILPPEMTVYTSGINSKLQKGTRVRTSGFTVSPHDAVVIKT